MKKISVQIIVLTVFIFSILPVFIAASEQNNRYDSVVYSLQIAASPYKLNVDSIKRINKINDEIIEFRKDGWYKYSVGSYSNKNDVRQKKVSFDNKNLFEGSFIIRLPRIDTYVSRDTNYVFRIQIKASEEQIAKDTLAKIYSLIDYIYEDKIEGWYKYSIGDFKNESEAKDYRNKIRQKKGLEKSFVVKRDRKISEEKKKSAEAKDTLAEVKDTLAVNVQSDKTIILSKKKSRILLNKQIIILTGIGIMMLLLALGLIFNYKKRKKTEWRIRNLIADYVFYERNEKYRDALIKEGKRSNKKRKIIKNIISLYPLEYSAMTEKLRSLLIDIKGEKLITKMKGFISNSNKEKKLTAMDIYLKMEKNEDEMLGKIEKPGSWEQLLILKYKQEVNEWGKYLENEDKDKVVLALRAISLLKLKQYASQIILLLNSSNEEIKKNAIMTLGELGMKETEINLQVILPLENEENKEIIELALSKIR